MGKKGLIKLVCDEMIEIIDNDEIKCQESYLMGFKRGLEKMSVFIIQGIVEEAKEQNIEFPQELKDCYESLQNSQT